MTNLNKNSTKIFKNLISLLSENYVKIDNSKGSFMPVSFEFLQTHNIMNLEMSMYSLAHYYDQNGDLMADPEMTFFVHENQSELFVYPASFRQDNLGIYEESIFINGSWQINSKLQKEHATFANIWLKNIKNQQSL